MNKQFSSRIPYFLRVLQQSPSAFADLSGSPEYPGVKGKVYFYQTRMGVLVFAQVFGLPTSDAVCKKRIFAFHIHSGSSCTGTPEDVFADAMSHYNPENCEHPSHAGDLLPLMGNKGYALEIFLTDRFSVSESMGKTVIIHSNPDDFTSQPSGNSGQKIACGVIRRFPYGQNILSF